MLITIGHLSTNVGVLNRSTKQYKRRKSRQSPYYQCIEKTTHSNMPGVTGSKITILDLTSTG